MKSGNVLFGVLISLSFFNCNTETPQTEQVDAIRQVYDVKFKVPNASSGSSVHFRLNNDNTPIVLDDNNSARISVNSDDLIQLVSDNDLKITLRITDGLDVLKHLHVWLYDPTYIFNCPNKELRGIINPGPLYPLTGVRVTNMSTTVHTSEVPNENGIYKMCFTGPTLHYKYALNNQSKKIEVEVAVPKDPDTRIDVYLTDSDPVIIPIK